MTHFADISMRIKVGIAGCNRQLAFTALLLFFLCGGMSSTSAHAQATKKFDISKASSNEAEIIRDGQPLNTKRVTVLPGQRINLSLHLKKPVGQTTVKYLWTVGGKTFDNYTISSENTYLTPIVPSNLRSQSIHFYWGSGSTNAIVVSCQYTITGKATKSLSANFNVMTPSCVFEDFRPPAPANTPQYQRVIYDSGAGPQLRWKNGTDLPSGLKLLTQVNLPADYKTIYPETSEGKVYVFQLMKDHIEETINNQVFFNKNCDQFCLDTFPKGPLYASDTAENPSNVDPNTMSYTALSTGTPYYYIDAPLVGRAVNVSSILRKASFSAYAMFIPPGIDSLPVPLKRLDWDMDFKFNWNGQKYEADPNYPTVINVPAQGSITSNHPEWDLLGGSGLNITEDNVGSLYMEAGQIPYSIKEPKQTQILPCVLKVTTPVVDTNGMDVDVFIDTDDPAKPYRVGFIASQVDNQNIDNQDDPPKTTVHINHGASSANFNVFLYHNDGTNDTVRLLVVCQMKNPSGNPNLIYQYFVRTIHFFDTDVTP